MPHFELASAMVNPATLPISGEKIAFLMVTALCSGMSIITCGFVVVTQGPSFKLTYDRERQRFLAFVSLLSAIFGLVSSGLELSDHPKSAGQSTASFFFNWLVQLGLAGIAHNSIVRLLTARAVTPAPEMLARASKLCCVFYLLTLPVMAPTFISLVHPSRSSVKTVARDMNIAFICAVEALATIADITLLWRFTTYKTHGHHTRKKMVQDMWIVYVSIWLSIGVDIFAKVFRDKTGDLIADLAITNLTLTLRAIAALMYGSTLTNAQEIYSLHSGAFGHSLSRSMPGYTKRPSVSQTLVGENEKGNQYRMNNIVITTEKHSDQGDESYVLQPKTLGTAE